MKQHQHHSEAVSSSSTSSSSTVSDQSQLVRASNTASEKPSPAPEDPPASGSAAACQDSVVVERRGGGEYSAICKWTIANFTRVKARALWSKYFEVGGYDCRLLVYPKGDSQALPGYISLYLQIMDPKGTKWDCFASYRLAIVNPNDEMKSIHRDSWHRFSSKKKSHGWCDFTPSGSIIDPKLGFLCNNDSIVVSADILVLNESFNFIRDNNNEMQSNAMVGSVVSSGPVGDVLSGKFTWKVHNFSLFREMIKTQKIMSPIFPAGECNLRISVYQSSVNGVDYMSMCLESKDTDKALVVADRSCWCLFRMSVLNQKPGLNHMHRDSYGRFAGDNKTGDNTSLGWNDYMKMSDFVGTESGFLVDDTAVFSTSYHVIKEFSSFSKNGGLSGARMVSGVRKSDGHIGKLTWRIENFTRLKDLLKKRKITGLCIKSRRFQIGNRDCRLIVYPRGQSQPPCHLSVFLEVTDSRNTSSDWSCFVSHRLSVVNQRTEDKSVTKESQNRYSKAAKDWGWREFVTLTSLFDQDYGFLVNDTVVFSAEVLILKETSVIQDFTDKDAESSCDSQIDKIEKMISFTWRVENFLSFKDIMETRKIFSKFFQAGDCELRIGVYESFDTICIYLESDQSVANDPDKNFWVRYRMAVLNQKNPGKTVWKESSICTKTWNNSVLQFMKVSDMLEGDAGFLARDTVVFVCEILDCCPWFDFSDLEVFASEDDQEALTTDPDELIDSEDSEGAGGDEEDIFRNLLSRAGFHLTYGDNTSKPQVTLREKLLMDTGAIAGFLTGLRVYLDDPTKAKRLLLPTKLSYNNHDGKKLSKNDESTPSVMDLLMGVKVLQQAIIDLLLDIMVECCQPLEGNSNDDYSDVTSKLSPDGSGAITPQESDRGTGALENVHLHVHDRLDVWPDESMRASAVQSSHMNEIAVPVDTVPGEPVSPPETCATGSSEYASHRSKTKWSELSEEILGLIVNSLRALDQAVPQGCPEPRRRQQSAQRIALVLDKAPKHLQPDVVALVPKLVEPSEHHLAACALLDRLQKADADGLHLPVFGALSQLECSCEVWERVLFQSFEILKFANDEPLTATMDFIFKAALHCQHLPEAVRSVRDRLKSLGPEVSPCVLDYISRTINTCPNVAEAILRDIDCDDSFDDNCTTMHLGVLLFDENGSSSERSNLVDEEALRATFHFSDTYILLYMLSHPCLAVEASQTFERAIARGTIMAQSVAMVLERRLVRRLNFSSQFFAENFQQNEVVVEGEAIEQLRAQQDDFTSILGLAETLGLSRDLRVRGFMKILYTLLFKWYADGSYRLRILKRLVDRSTGTTDGSREVDLDMEILVSLVCEEQEIVGPVLSMIRDVAELANLDRAALWHQLCASEDEILHIREEMKAELSSMAKEKAVLAQSLSESEATNNRFKSDMRVEVDRFGRERKELSEQLHEVESQLEWLRAERDDEIGKLTAEKKALQDHLHDAETQLSQLKSRKRDELKRVAKEKNALAERLRNTEAARKRFDEELKRCATENVTREEIRRSLEDEVRLLKQTVGQTEGEKREKEEQVARCEAYIDGMESKLQACQQYIRTLESSLQEEMSRHAPLYGAGLEALSMKELETISRIHEEGLRQIHALQQRSKGSSSSAAGSPLSSPHALTLGGLYPVTPAPPPMAVGLPTPSLIPNGAGNGIHNNGHVNGGAVGPWFNHS